MKLLKYFLTIIMICALMCTVVMLSSCDAGEAEYKVTVKDSLGTPYSEGIIVKFMQNGEQVAMQTCDEKGVAKKTLAKGDYTVELNFTDSEADFHFITEDLSLADKKTELDVILAMNNTADATTLYVDSVEFDAYPVEVGCTYVKLNAGERSYFLFTPKEAGNYEFSIIDNDKAELGYYGAPHYVQSTNKAEVKDGSFTISIRPDMIGSGSGGTSVYVLGVDFSGDKESNCVIGIRRLGDYIKTIEDEPWTVYEKTVELAEYTLPENAEIKEFDLTESTGKYPMVFNEEDGFYHLNEKNGPLVLVRLAEDCDYIACFKTILDRSAVTKYFFDEDGAFVKKETYDACLREYIDCADEDFGVYPLTKDLMYIIQMRGENEGWWDIDGQGYIFKDIDGNRLTDINAEIAWLLMCCYID